MAGKKFDSHKVMFDVSHWVALTEIAKVATHGAQKYGKHNWLDGLEWSRIANAMLRHFIKFWLGEDTDKDSKLSHLAHMGWGATALLTCYILKVGKDDRWVPVDPELRARLLEYVDKNFDMTPEQFFGKMTQKEAEFNKEESKE